MDDKPSIGPPANPRGVNGFVMNLIVPGLGSIYCGKGGVGVGQLILFALGVILCFPLFLLGIPLIIAAWIWSAIVGFQLLTTAG